MSNFVPFLRCLGKAVLKRGVRALVGLVPLAGEVYDIAADALDDYRKQHREEELREEIAALAATPQQTIEAVVVAEVVTALAAGQSPEAVAGLVSYLTQVPAAVRRSLRRLGDPTGTTVPPTLALNRPEVLARLLPDRLPRFKVGQQPLVSVDWELVELLGVGGFGEVWKARNPHRPSLPPVALKFCLDTAAAAALRNEVRLLDRVMQQGHLPGLVHLEQTYLRADPPCLQYEYVAGGDLEGLMRDAVAEGGMKPDAATGLVLDLAKIIGAMHRLDPPIVHRDLKPANILVQRGASGGVALRVADLGIGDVASAQIIQRAKSRPTSYHETLPTALRGAHTPIYASPQQRKGAKAEPRDDVHALGVIWHQLLTGDTTAERPGGKGWRRKLEGRAMTAGLIDLLESCMDDEPDERPADAQDLAERIEKLRKPVSLAILEIPVPPKAARPGEVVEVRVGAIQMKFAWIPPGSFVMGSPPTERGRSGDEQQHRVTLTKGLFLGIYQVTRGQFAHFVEASGYMTQAESSGAIFGLTRKESGIDPDENWRTPGFDQTDDHPVTYVSWNDAVALCEWMTKNDKKGRHYRLPTEAEWEYACRAGATTTYPWGDRIESGKGWCNIADQTAQKSIRDLEDIAPWKDGYVYTSPVGIFRANAWNLHDVIGNVAEWCQDYYDYLYSEAEAIDPKGPLRGDTRVIRGGTWRSGPEYCRSAYRFRVMSFERGPGLGCRIAFDQD